MTPCDEAVTRSRQYRGVCAAPRATKPLAKLPKKLQLDGNHHIIEAVCEVESLNVLDSKEQETALKTSSESTSRSLNDVGISINLRFIGEF